MLNIYFYGCLWIGFLKTLSFEEIPIETDRNVTATNDKGALFENSTSSIIVENTDVYDEFLKVILFDGLKFRSAVTNKDKVWEHGIVPYIISDEYTEENKDFILESIEEFHNKTCVKFHQRKKEASYIMLVPGTGCSAVVGKVSNKTNRVNLHKNCFVKGIVLHELMHALGFIHEQNRPDRDKFVKIMFDNIRKGSEKNFDKYSEGDLHLFNHTYDFESVMHYGAQDFAIDRKKPTIIPLKENVEIGQRKGFSQKDLAKINLLYNCTNKENSANSTKVSKENITNRPGSTKDENITNRPESTKENATNRPDSTKDATVENSSKPWTSSLYKLSEKYSFEDEDDSSEEKEDKNKKSILYYILKHS